MITQSRLPLAQVRTAAGVTRKLWHIAKPGTEGRFEVTTEEDRVVGASSPPRYDQAQTMLRHWIANPQVTIQYFDNKAVEVIFPGGPQWKGEE